MELLPSEICTLISKLKQASEIEAGLVIVLPTVFLPFFLFSSRFNNRRNGLALDRYHK